MPVEHSPYLPPSEIDDARRGESTGKFIARICILMYGVIFTLFCVWGTVGDILTPEPILETVFWLVLSVLTCYGIFAVAIRRMRMLSLGTFWRYFGAALPIVTLIDAGWSMYHEPPLPLVEFVAMLTLSALFLAPALMCNWMLRSRLTPSPSNGG